MILLNKRINFLALYTYIVIVVLECKRNNLLWSLIYNKKPIKCIQFGMNISLWIVIYFHNLKTTFREGLLYVEELLKLKISVCIFDFSGSGLSEGEYISLGYYE